MDKEKILKKLTKIEDKLLVSKVLDKAAKAENIWDLTWSDFLDPHQKNVVDMALSGEKSLNYVFNGGYDGAERVVIIFSPNFISSDDLPVNEPFKVINIGINGREALTHRDYLGSLMGLGIKREKIGDILVKEDSCSIIVLNEIAEFIKYNLVKVGTSRVQSEIVEVDKLQPPEAKVKEINSTVASLRLDCVASAGFGISRSKIVEFIKGEKVNLNWDTVTSLSRQVNEGDTISIRGKGRVVLEEIGRTTRKDRIVVRIKKLI